MVNIAEKADYLPGGKIADYLVLSQIGRGSYGCLYLVEDVTKARYALKILNKGSDLEFTALQKIRKIPHCRGMVVLHAAGRLPDGRIYYLMDAADNLLTDGGYLPDTLANRLARNGRFQMSEVLRFASSILPAIKHLHDHGFAHHDIKPENIIFIGGDPLLADFGSLSNGISDEEFPASSFAFYPPEELDGSVNGRFSPKNDLYALGMTLYCAWSGRAPEEYPRLPDDVDPADIRIVRKLVQKACNASPSYRFQKAEDFIKAVEQAQKEVLFPSVRKRRILFCAAAAAVILAIVAGTIFLRQTAKAKKEFRLAWMQVEMWVDFAKQANPEQALSDLQYAEKSLDEKALKETQFKEVFSQFQRMRDLLQEYDRWEKADGKEKKISAKKAIGIMKSLDEKPPSLKDTSSVASHLAQMYSVRYHPERHEFLRPVELELYDKLQPICGEQYNQLKLETASAKLALNINEKTRKSLTLKGKVVECEAKLERFRKEYELETRYIDLASQAEMLLGSNLHEVIEIKKQLDPLKEKLNAKYRSAPDQEAKH